MDFYLNLASVAANAFFRRSVTDIAEDFSRDFFIIRMGFAGDFASDENEFGGCENLTGYVGIWVASKCSVKNSTGVGTDANSCCWIDALSAIIQVTNSTK